MTDDELVEECNRDIILAHNSGATVEIVFNVGTAWLMISQLQLALRHPSNTGPGAAKARELINVLAIIACTTPATQEMLRRGFDPAYDVTQ